MSQDHADAKHAAWKAAARESVVKVDEGLFNQLMVMTGCNRSRASWIVANRASLLPLLAESLALHSKVADCLVEAAPHHLLDSQ